MKNKRGYFKQLPDGKIIFEEHPDGQFLIRDNEDDTIAFLSGIDPIQQPDNETNACEIRTWLKSGAYGLTHPQLLEEMLKYSKYYGDNLVAESDSGILYANLCRLNGTINYLKNKSKVNVIKYRRS